MGLGQHKHHDIGRWAHINAKLLHYCSLLHQSAPGISNYAKYARLVGHVQFFAGHLISKCRARAQNYFAYSDGYKNTCHMSYATVLLWDDPECTIWRANFHIFRTQYTVNPPPPSNKRRLGGNMHYWVVAGTIQKLFTEWKWDHYYGNYYQTRGK